MKTNAFKVKELLTLFNAVITLFITFVVILQILVGKETIRVGICIGSITGLAHVIAQAQIY